MAAMADWRERLAEADRETLQPGRMPQWVKPMLAALREQRFSAPDWNYECKLDGVRCLAFRRDGRVGIYPRNQHRLNASHREFDNALLERPA